MHVSAIIAAGGRGTRLGGDRLKQLLPLAGRSILERSVAAFVDHPSVDEVIVALPESLLADPPEYLRPARRVSSSRARAASDHGATGARVDSPLKTPPLVAGG